MEHEVNVDFLNDGIAFQNLMRRLVNSIPRANMAKESSELCPYFFKFKSYVVIFCIAISYHSAASFLFLFPFYAFLGGFKQIDHAHEN